ncbi:MAG: PTS lactose/cellobiose transporter subunit IIA [Tissierellia bacterium]|nr:PTS lactose/cellobiose transporter subunit IIA [Tissierellia bacterium]
MKTLEEICFGLITHSGDAKSLLYEALNAGKKGDFEKARQKIKESEEDQLKAHRVHMELITRELNEKDIDFSLILVHAEDQMMQTELLSKLVEEFLEIYEKLEK